MKRGLWLAGERLATGVLVCMLLLGVLLGAGCAQDQTGDRSLSVVDDDAILVRHRLAASELRREPGVSSDPRLVEPVRRIAGALLARAGLAPEDYRFDVAEFDWPNAFAYADGSIFVTRGQMVLMNTEHELAVLLGHEIAHVAARHSLERANRDALLAGATLLGSAFGLRDAAAAILIPSYSRADETEADELGTRWAKAAGYDSTCGSQLFAAFERLRKRNERSDDFYTSHPPAGERRDRGREGAYDPAACRDEYAGRIAGAALHADGQDYFLIGERTLAMPRIGLRVTLPEKTPKDIAVFPARVLARAREEEPPILVANRPQLLADFEHYAPGVDIEWARERAARPEDHGSQRVLSRDETPVGGRPSVRVVRAQEIRGLRWRASYHWIQGETKLFRIRVRATAKEWDEVEPIALALAEGAEELPPERLATEPIVGRVHFHELGEGETLDDVVARYPDWDAEELAIYNPWPDEHVPAPGEQIKVIAREPVVGKLLEARAGHVPLGGADDELELDAVPGGSADEAAAYPPPELADAELAGHWVLDVQSSRLFLPGVEEAELRIGLRGDDVAIDRRLIRLGKTEIVQYVYRTDDTPHEIAADGGPHEYDRFGSPRNVHARWKGDRLEVRYVRDRGQGFSFDVKEVWRVRGKRKLEVKTTYSARYGGGTTREIYLRK